MIGEDCFFEKDAAQLVQAHYDALVMIVDAQILIGCKFMNHQQKNDNINPRESHQELAGILQ